MVPIEGALSPSNEEYLANSSFHREELRAKAAATPVLSDAGCESEAGSPLPAEKEAATIRKELKKYYSDICACFLSFNEGAFVVKSAFWGLVNAICGPLGEHIQWNLLGREAHEYILDRAVGVVPNCKGPGVSAAQKAAAAKVRKARAAYRQRELSDKRISVANVPIFNNVEISPRDALDFSKLSGFVTFLASQGIEGSFGPAPDADVSSGYGLAPGGPHPQHSIAAYVPHYDEEWLRVNCFKVSEAQLLKGGYDRKRRCAPSAFASDPGYNAGDCGRDGGTACLGSLQGGEEGLFMRAEPIPLRSKRKKVPSRMPTSVPVTQRLFTLEYGPDDVKLHLFGPSPSLFDLWLRSPTELCVSLRVALPGADTTDSYAVCALPFATSSGLLIPTPREHYMSITGLGDVPSYCTIQFRRDDCSATVGHATHNATHTNSLGYSYFGIQNPSSPAPPSYPPAPASHPVPMLWQPLECQGQVPDIVLPAGDSAGEHPPHSSSAPMHGANALYHPLGCGSGFVSTLLSAEEDAGDGTV